MKQISTEQIGVVATVTRADDLEFLKSGSYQGSDILEFRLDNLSSRLGAVEALLSSCKLDQFGILLTARAPEEGGQNQLSAADRAGILRRFLSFGSAIDVEIRNLENEELEGVIDTARQQGTSIIGSFHDFEKFPQQGFLQDKIDAARDLGVDIPKIAVFVEDFSQLHQLAEIVSGEREKNRPVSAMGMGPLGKLSRLVLAKAGSCLNYGYLQQENAPGQWPADQLRQLIGEL